MACLVLSRPPSHPSGEGVIVIHPAPKARRPGEDDASFHARVFAQTLAKNPSMQGLASLALTVEQLPSRRFRNAWRLVAGQVVEDLPTCRAIRLTEIRRDRDARLLASDGPYTRALERGEDLTALKAYRQGLRDVPQSAGSALDACASPSMVAAYEPSWPARVV